MKVPRSAIRPGNVSQQGGRNLTPHDVENGGGLGGGPGHHRGPAIRWAKSQLGFGRWAWHCERFVEEAYGTRAQYDTAIDAAHHMTLNGGKVTAAPAGALIYFAADKYNQGWGHVGLSLGRGRMISALGKVDVVDVQRNAYWRGLYLGWVDAPDEWPGRIPPPPGPTTDDPTLAVRITAPAPASEQGGTVGLMATTTGASGVAFDAYYATDPSNPSTRAWHPLGQAKPVDGGWELDWATFGIPDQGFTKWDGTVNIAAIALDRSGHRTTTRDYRRLSINNTPPSAPDGTPGPPPPPPPPPNTTFSETAGGQANTWSDYRIAGGSSGPQIQAGETVQIACKIQGFRVPDGNNWWYRIAESPWSSQYYVTGDAFYNNGQTSGSLRGTPFVDPRVPDC